MSVNYHAFQSRGVPFAEYEAVSAQWYSEFTGYNPRRAERILHLKVDEKYLYVPYYGTAFRLRLADGHLEKQSDGQWSEELYFNEAMAVYHLLHYVKDTPAVSGAWVPSHTLDGVVSRNAAGPDPLLAPFAKYWSGRCDDLEEACRQLGGKKIEKGDVGYEFEAFPMVHLQLIFWDLDEDFPAQVQIMADKCVTDFVHYETVGCIISDLLEKLCGIPLNSNKTEEK